MDHPVGCFYRWMVKSLTESSALGEYPTPRPAVSLRLALFTPSFRGPCGAAVRLSRAYARLSVLRKPPRRKRNPLSQSLPRAALVANRKPPRPLSTPPLLKTRRCSKIWLLSPATFVTVSREPTTSSPHSPTKTPPAFGGNALRLLLATTTFQRLAARKHSFGSRKPIATRS